MKLKPTILASRNRISKEDRQRNRIDKIGLSILLPLFEAAKEQWSYNPAISIEDNATALNNLFIVAISQLRSYYNSVAIAGTEYGKKQVIAISKRYRDVRIKAENSYEIEVNWAMADQQTLDWLNGGGDFTSGYFDIVTGLAASTNRDWLRTDYARYIAGEITLEETTNRLRNAVFGAQRANIIIRTNVTDIFATGQQEAYATAGHIENTWFSRWDERVCIICGKLHGMSTVIGEPFPGTNITKPAAHLACRCFLSPTPLSTEQLRAYFENEGLLPNAKIKPKRVKPVTITKPIAPTPTVPITPAHNKVDLPVSTIDKAVDHEIKRNQFIDKLLGVDVEIDRKRRSLSDQADRLHNDILITSKRLKELTGKDREDEFNKLAKLSGKSDKVNNERMNLFQTKKFKTTKVLYDVNGRERQDRRFDDLDGIPPTKEFENGLRVFDRLISDKYQTPDKVQLYTKYPNSYSDYRSYYEPHKNGTGHYGTLNLRSNASDTVAIHELGHWLDNGNAKLNERVHEFYNVRTQGESPVRINQLPGYTNAGFADSEVTRLDKFMHPYMGKDYGDKIHEITSMGLEEMFKDPVQFYRKDSHYFNFIYDVMTGRVLDDDYSVPDFKS